MPIETAVLFLFSVLVSTLLLWYSYKLKSANDSKYLELYFYYMVAVIGYGYVNWIGLTFIPDFGDKNVTDSYSAITLFIACAVPLSLFKLYLFVLFLIEFIGLKSQKLIVRNYYIFSALSIFIAYYMLALDFGTQALHYSSIFLTLFGILIAAANLISIFYYLSKVELFENKSLQKAAAHFGWAYLLGFIIYLSPYYVNYFVEVPSYGTLGPYVYYVLHLIPLFYLKQFSELHNQIKPQASSASYNFHSIVKKFNISIRESTILELVLSGKKNDEIANQLCISPNTVRNHIYNIYTKTKVKNRIQLKSLCDGDNMTNKNIPAY